MVQMAKMFQPVAAVHSPPVAGSAVSSGDGGYWAAAGAAAGGGGEGAYFGDSEGAAHGVHLLQGSGGGGSGLADADFVTTVAYSVAGTQADGSVSLVQRAFWDFGHDLHGQLMVRRRQCFQFISARFDHTDSHPDWHQLAHFRLHENQRVALWNVYMTTSVTSGTVRLDIVDLGTGAPTFLADLTSSWLPCPRPAFITLRLFFCWTAQTVSSKI